MKGKIFFVVGLGVGYVLGTRAGRERYEQIRRAAESVWNQPTVQQGVGTVKEFAMARVGDLSDTVLDSVKGLIGNATKSSGATRKDVGRAARSAKQNISKAADAAKSAVDDAASKLDDAVEDAADAASKSASKSTRSSSAPKSSAAKSSAAKSSASKSSASKSSASKSSASKSKSSGSSTRRASGGRSATSDSDS